MNAAHQRWQDGQDAFLRGEVPPVNSEAADGWYYAQNAVARQQRDGLSPDTGDGE